MSSAKVVIHTDVILEYLRGTRRPTALRQAMGVFFCYTTVFNAVQVFALLRTPHERKAAAEAMSAMKLLGLNAKNSMRYGDLFAAHPALRPMDLLVAGLCLESRLPLLTDCGRDFRGIRGLTIVPARAVGGAGTGAEIDNALQR